MNISARRLLFATVLFAVIGLLVPLRIVYLQFGPQADRIRAQEVEGQYVVVQPPRGEIYDRNGRLLAGNQVVYEIGIDLTQMENPETLALTLSVLLELDHDALLAQLEHPPEGLRYLVVKDFVSQEVQQQLADLQAELAQQAAAAADEATHPPSLAGLQYREHFFRFYPQRTLAANVLGFVNYEYRGVLGVEEQYDVFLGGRPERIWVPRSPLDADQVEMPANNASLELTLDVGLQGTIENILDDALVRYGAQSGVIVVMDPRSGEIWAMASAPRFDPNRFWEYGEYFDNAAEYNRAVSMVYEPGSVFKVLTMAAGLDANVIEPDTTFLDTGIYYIGQYAVYNWNRAAWGEQTMTGCLAHSLNVCLAWIADEMGVETFYRYMRAFGLGRKTGIDLANEAAGRLKLPGDADWYPLELGTNAFGQGVAVTPVQMLAAASAVANEGQMVAPHVVQAVVGENGRYEVPLQTIGAPISAETARVLNQMLADAVNTETSLATLPGYRLAGKTGTAEIPGEEGTNTSFIGWGPVDDPQFMIYVWLERPTASIWASEVAAPVFRDAAQATIDFLNLPPDDVRLAADR